MFRFITALSVALLVTLVEPISVLDAESVPQKRATVDTTLQRAKAAREAIETREKDVAQSIGELLSELETTISKIPSPALEEEQQALDHLKDVAAVLCEQSENILKKREAYARDFRSLQEALESAPAEFRQAGEAFRQYAQDEPFEDIQGVYHGLAESWDNLAKQTEQRANEPSGPDVDEWEAGCRYIASIARFASRLEEHLDAFPSTDQLNRQRKYSEELQSLIKHFETLKELLQEFNSRLANDALASNLRTAPSTRTSTSPVRLVSHTKTPSDTPPRTTSATSLPNHATNSDSAGQVPDSVSQPSYLQRQVTVRASLNPNDVIPKDPSATNVAQLSHTASSRRESQASATQPRTSGVPAHHRGYYR